MQQVSHTCGYGCHDEPSLPNLGPTGGNVRRDAIAGEETRCTSPCGDATPTLSLAVDLGSDDAVVTPYRFSAVLAPASPMRHAGCQATGKRWGAPHPPGICAPSK